MSMTLATPTAPTLSSGFEAYVGPVTKVEGREAYTLSFPIEQHHLNGADMLHGGMMMSFASITLAGAAREAAGDAVETLSINCDFTGPGKPGDVVTATATITRRTRTVVFLSCDVQVEDADAAAPRMLMAATGVFRIATKKGSGKTEAGA